MAENKTYRYFNTEPAPILESNLPEGAIVNHYDTPKEEESVGCLVYEEIVSEKPLSLKSMKDNLLIEEGDPSRCFDWVKKLVIMAKSFDESMKIALRFIYKQAKVDEQLQAAIILPHKNGTRFVDYLMNQAKAMVEEDRRHGSVCVAVPANDVYGWSLDYFFQNDEEKCRLEESDALKREADAVIQKKKMEEQAAKRRAKAEKAATCSEKTLSSEPEEEGKSNEESEMPLNGQLCLV